MDFEQVDSNDSAEEQARKREHNDEVQRRREYDLSRDMNSSEQERRDEWDRTHS